VDLQRPLTELADLVGDFVGGLGPDERACSTKAEAHVKLVLLEQAHSNDFSSSCIFWDAKRPITARVLRRLVWDGLREVNGSTRGTPSA